MYYKKIKGVKVRLLIRTKHYYLGYLETIKLHFYTFLVSQPPLVYIAFQTHIHNIDIHDIQNTFRLEETICVVISI